MTTAAIAMDTYAQIASRIIREQEQLMGPVAWNEAGKVQGLRVEDAASGTVSVEPGADERLVVDALVNRFGDLFGRAAREVCKEAVGALIADLPPSEVPTSLR